MEQFRIYEAQESFERFERAAAKGHEESIWITSVVKGVKMEESALIEAFAKTEEPLGWYFAAKFLISAAAGREQFDFFKKSAEAGCSWGQLGYGGFFRFGLFVEKDMKLRDEWFCKAANQKNPSAMNHRGYWFRHILGYDEMAMPYYRASADLGWKKSMHDLAMMFRHGQGCAKDLRQAVVWSAKGDSSEFSILLRDAKRALESGTTEDLGCDFDQLCYTLGWALYWYRSSHKRAGDFENSCLDYYCSCVELQQKSIFTFLLCWNRATGVKGPGQMIAQMVWEQSEDNLVKTFEKPPRRSARLKRIKK
jgi:hypothetical protein